MRKLQGNGLYRRRKWCSNECRIWLRRADRALENGDAAEAAEVMRLSAVLDSRRSPAERVDDVFEHAMTGA